MGIDYSFYAFDKHKTKELLEKTPQQFLEYLHSIFPTQKARSYAADMTSRMNEHQMTLSSGAFVAELTEGDKKVIGTFYAPPPFGQVKVTGKPSQYTTIRLSEIQTDAELDQANALIITPDGKKITCQYGKIKQLIKENKFRLLYRRPRIFIGNRTLEIGEDDNKTREKWGVDFTTPVWKLLASIKPTDRYNYADHHTFYFLRDNSAIFEFIEEISAGRPRSDTASDICNQQISRVLKSGDASNSLIEFFESLGFSLTEEWKNDLKNEGYCAVFLDEKQTTELIRIVEAQRNSTEEIEREPDKELRERMTTGNIERDQFVKKLAAFVKKYPDTYLVAEAS